MPFLSVIIPVYNVEKYLNQCVDSVINQNLDDIEIILVDDGSPDNCPQICDFYAEKYDYVKVIHKKNGGLSSARNSGIDDAQGDYIIFMDSDDWWNPDVSVKDMLSYVKEHPQTEMYLFTSFDYIEGEGYFKRNEHENFANIDVSSVKSYYQSLLNNGNMEVSANTKILKTSFIKENKLYFTENLLSEDNEWIIRVLRVASKVDKLEYPLYLCRLGRADSITNSIRKKNITDLLGIVKKSIDYCAENNNFTFKELELCFCSYLWFCAMGLCTCLSKEEKKDVRELFDNSSSVCAYSNSRKTKLCNRVYKIFGLRITMFILGKYIKLKGNKKTFKTKVEI